MQSLSPAEIELRSLRYLLEVNAYQNGGGKGAKPKPPSAPETHIERRQKAARLEAKRKRSERMQARFQRRHEKLQQMLGEKKE